MSSGCLRHFRNWRPGQNPVAVQQFKRILLIDTINGLSEFPVFWSSPSFYCFVCFFFLSQSFLSLNEVDIGFFSASGSLCHYGLLCVGRKMLFLFCYLYWACIRVSLKRSLKWRGVYRSQVGGSVPNLQFIFFVFKVAEIKESTPLGSSLHLFSHNQDYLSGSLNDPSGNLKLIENCH